MGGIGREYRPGDVAIPPVTPAMMAAAVRIVLGASRDAEDAGVLLAALGFTRADLAESRAGRNGKSGKH
jgi:hypothetical protein